MVANISIFPIKFNIKKKTGFDVISSKNKPLNKVSMIKQPGYFLIGENDEFIDFVKF